MRILHIVKTSSGASWAAFQAAELTGLGTDVHVALPDTNGGCMPIWQESRATVHVADLDFPAGEPWLLPSICDRARALVASIQPDLIHTHHLGTTLLLRHALGKRHRTPRVFQIPGPLHLEHWLYRNWDLASAGPCDFWIASSRCVREHYRRAGVNPDRVFLSYYGIRPSAYARVPGNLLRRRFRIPAGMRIAGNISHIYGPKYYLGQRTGLKRHEDLIEALVIVLAERPDVIGLLVGGPWGRAERYQERLRRLAAKAGRGRILMPGHLAAAEVREVWPEFDCAIHAPLSENCGGVVEPLLAGVPVVAAAVGGLPEVIKDGVTGTLVPPQNPEALASGMLKVFAEPGRYRGMARRGGELVEAMFDVRRTSREVHQVYRHILSGEEPPVPFDADLALRLGRSVCRAFST